MGVSSPFLLPSERGPLGQYLWELRKAAQMTLRDVEEASERKVSNAYLSQLETGRITKPSPAILQELTKAYSARLPGDAKVSCSYDRMMELAGHLMPTSKLSGNTEPSQLIRFGVEELTSDEADELLNYLAYIRMRNSKR